MQAGDEMKVALPALRSAWLHVQEGRATTSLWLHVQVWLHVQEGDERVVARAGRR